MKGITYTPPTVELVSVAVERGFAESNYTSQVPDYNTEPDEVEDL